MMTLYISDDDANYRTEIFTHVFSTIAAERDFNDWEPVALGAAQGRASTR
ncbi:hypothetical protein ENSA5_57200 [Enhygromyxa salina]|uniref:Uncharacterized protein n=1 Tax=Enhygromyxa salina TaxID=215803 RepID=A0A2S9XEG2_9BACT|nr:hypothetical protein [Enhygromyxa salina]PRP91245.1 hypothetical protein ENSA5_57200 [Enhygromyxa salina]